MIGLPCFSWNIRHNQALQIKQIETVLFSIQFICFKTFTDYFQENPISGAMRYQDYEAFSGEKCQVFV